jgi:hypothetical protein
MAHNQGWASESKVIGAILITTQENLPGAVMFARAGFQKRRFHLQEDAESFCTIVEEAVNCRT